MSLLNTSAAAITELLYLVAPGYLGIVVFQIVLAYELRLTSQSEAESNNDNLTVPIINLNSSSVILATVLISFAAAFVLSLTGLGINDLVAQRSAAYWIKLAGLSVALGLLSGLLMGNLDRRILVFPRLAKSAWTILWERHYDSKRHFVAIRLNGTEIYGEISNVDSQSVQGDLVLKNPFRSISSTVGKEDGSFQEVVEVESFGAYLHIQADQAGFLRLVDKP